MPIPSLSIDIVQEVTSHLRTPLKSDTHEAIEAGQALSLVCRRWYPIGQALRWQDLEMDITSVPSLLAHFDLYPHLALLVNSFKLSERAQANSKEAGDGEAVDVMPRLLSSFGNLEYLNLRQLYPNFPTVLGTAATLPHLLELQLLSEDSLGWNRHLASTLVAGFPSLRNFSLTTLEDLVLEDVDSFTVNTRGLKSVTNMAISWSNSSGSNFVHSFLSIFDPTALRNCSLIGVPACATAYEWLVDCPNLSSLRVAIVCGSLTLNFPALLYNISKYKSLEWIEYKVFGRPQQDLYHSPVAIKVILASLPPTLYRFSVRNLFFADSDESHDLGITDSVPDDNLQLIEGMVSTDEGYRCAVIWKDKGDTKSPQGHRMVLDFEFWAEAAVAYVSSRTSSVSLWNAYNLQTPYRFTGLA